MRRLVKHSLFLRDKPYVTNWVIGKVSIQTPNMCLTVYFYQNNSWNNRKCALRISSLKIFSVKMCGQININFKKTYVDKLVRGKGLENYTLCSTDVWNKELVSWHFCIFGCFSPDQLYSSFLYLSLHLNNKLANSRSSTILKIYIWRLYLNILQNFHVFLFVQMLPCYWSLI